MQNPARKEPFTNFQSSAFRRQHTVVHVSAIMLILPGYSGTYIRGYALSGHYSRRQISVKNEGYLFTGFYGIGIKEKRMCVILLEVINTT